MSEGRPAPDVTRFREAQDRDGTWERSLAELTAGRKSSHWMWFVFPQLAGLGSSPMAQRYAIGGIDEAAAYLADEVLGARLVQAATVLLGLDTDDPVEVLGGIDAVKLRSSMTLFELVPGSPDVLGRVLDRFFGGEGDPKTLQLLGS